MKKIIQTDKEKFTDTQYDPNKTDRYLNVDLMQVYEWSSAEVGLQQNKRDQLVAIYFSMFSVLTAILSTQDADWRIGGWIFLAVAIVGYLFSTVILRYRIYKETLWLCCETLTVMMACPRETLGRENIRALYYEAMYKKARKFLKPREEGEDNSEPPGIDDRTFLKVQSFSAETTYYLVHAFITAALFGLSIGILLGSNAVLAPSAAVAVGALCGIGLIAVLMARYFRGLKAVYMVLEDGLEDSFLGAFSKAWFLHFY